MYIEECVSAKSGTRARSLLLHYRHHAQQASCHDVDEALPVAPLIPASLKALLLARLQCCLRLRLKLIFLLLVLLLLSTSSSATTISPTPSAQATSTTEYTKGFIVAVTHDDTHCSGRVTRKRKISLGLCRHQLILVHLEQRHVWYKFSAAITTGDTGAHTTTRITTYYNDDGCTLAAADIAPKIRRYAGGCDELESVEYVYSKSGNVTPAPSPQPTVLPTPAPTQAPVAYNPYCGVSPSSIQLALSMRRKNQAYTGPLFTFRRDSDDVQLDFYADFNGNLGTQVGASGTLFSTWIGSSKAFVVKWYDQSGTSNHATQSTSSLQGFYDPINKFVDFTNGGWMNLPDGTIPFGNNPYSIVAKHGVINNPGGDIIGQGYAGHSNKCCTLRRKDSRYRHFYWASDYDFDSYAAGNIVSVSYDQSNRRGWVNHNYVSLMATSNRAGEAERAMLANDDPGDVMNGQIYFVYVANIALVDTDRLALENDMTC